jgi:hypothetical protein
MRRGASNDSGRMKRRMTREGASSRTVSATQDHDIVRTEKESNQPTRRNHDARTGFNASAVTQRRAPSAEDDREMAALTETKAKTMGLDREEPAAEFFGQRKKREIGQFRLQVDRQTKASYATREAAEKAGLAIKTAFPILQVLVHDAADGVHTAIELPNT